MREYRLDNGLHVICEKGSSKIARAMLNMDVGSVHDTIPGIAHFFEHAFMSGGTSKYSIKEQKAINDTFHYTNAITYKDRTSITAEFLPEELPKFIEYAVQTMFYPKFGNIEQQRSRIIRELIDGASKYDVLYKEYWSQVFGESWGRSQGGTVDSVRSITKDDIKNFHGLYGGVNAQLFIAGVDFGDLKIDIPRGKKVEPVSPLANKVRYVRRLKESSLVDSNNPDSSSAHIEIGFYMDEFSVASRLRNSFLAKEIGIRLLDELSDKRGLCYHFKADNDVEVNNNVIKISGKVHHESLDEAIDIVFDVLQDCKQRIVNYDQLMKGHRTGYLKYLENPDSILDKLFCKYTENFDFNNIFKIIANTKEKDIIETAQMLPSKDGLMYMVTMHPFKGEEL